MPLTELQRKKMLRLFTVLDTDRDGLLREEDFTRRAEMFARARGWDEQTPAYQEHLKFNRDDWRALRRFADDDHDSSVTPDEFLSFADVMFMDRQAVEAYAYTDALLLFKAMDTDDDGRVTEEEYHAYLAMYGLDRQAAREFFGRADADGDGHITGGELIEAMREFLLSDDPVAPGSYLYGPLD